ncbi:sensor domain-containing protein [Mycolicibacterium sp. GF69]|uniref:sensor domain-containing protein n=1 Tax=Mycolicibacterium sp. GF69 TaxID=2267251 RepID=UPI00140275C4|nr:sensor domain-containing protein [Mycolicibacterium sp. GF69]
MFRLTALLPGPRAARLGFCCLIATSVLSACATTVDGSARSAGVSTAEPSNTPTAPVVVPAAAAEASLLKRHELAAIIGDIDLSEVESYTGPNRSSSDAFEPSDCVHRLEVAKGIGYGADGRRAIAGDTNKGANGRIAAQVISVWENRHQPRGVLGSVRRSWSLCRDGEQFTVAGADGEKEQYWVAGAISGVNENRAGTVAERREPPGWTCHHVFATQANVAVETMACGDGDTAAQADEIADRILARLPR